MSTDPQPRLPDPTALIPELREIGAALYKATGNGTVPKSTISLMHLRAGQIVANTYLTIMHSGILRKTGETEERITAVASWPDATCFTDAERVALALVEAVLSPSPSAERVPDALYAEVRRHYDETATATLIMAIGQVCFYIPLALIGKPLPGVPPTQQWRP